MCGICGVLGTEDKKLIKRMLGVLTHRGPDDRGTYFDRGVSLGHARLSIIDLETGHQPLSNEEDSIWIIYNGETYNYRELRAELEGKGHVFKTDSDTEVIVHLYEEYGKGCIERLRGMFAFAIWDAGEKTLFLARDRLGQKPIYYTSCGGDFVFASEIKAILEHPGVKRRVNVRALNAYATHQYVPSPLTMFKDIYKLRPGHHITVRDGEVTVEKYWDVNLDERGPKTQQECTKTIRKLLEESVSMRLVSDVPLGIYLSGGLDSSTIVALASRQGRETVKTVSVGFEWADIDERPYSRLVAEAFNTDHTEVVVADDAMERFPDIIWYLDEPLADYAVIPTYLLSGRAREHATVYLTGDGGDELFGGYTKYKWARKREFLFNIPFTSRLLNAAVASRHVGDMLDGLASSKDVRNVVKTAGDLEGTYMRGSRVLTEETKGEVFGKRTYDSNPFDVTVKPHIEHALNSKSDFINRMLYLDAKTWLAEDFLMKMDRSSMAHSIEARAPFLDHILVDAAFGMPSNLKVGLRGEGKVILKKAVGDILPKEILARRKQGFEVPVDDWLKKELRANIDEVPEFLDDTGFFRKTKALRMLDHYMSCDKRDKAYENGRRLWALMYAFKVWHEIFIAQERHVK
jgi:asparagine synthase (glutamine-hydrolysing)